jgi:chromosome segregation ATPase
VIIITHRPASLALADRIIKVTAQGLSEIELRGRPASAGSLT